MQNIHAGILGLGTHVPGKRLKNPELEALVETTDDWIRTRTGINERRIAARGEGTSDLAALAARSALADAEIGADEIDLIVVATSTPDLLFPPTAALVQRQIKAERAAAFDLNGVCAGFLYGMVTGSQFIASGTYRHVLVIGADVLSRHVDYSDRNTCILFGDGAGAVVLGPVPSGYGLLDFDLHADGGLAQLAVLPHQRSPFGVLEDLGVSQSPYIQQDGRAVFKVAVQRMAESAQTVLDRLGLRMEDLAVLVPHQANGRIMSALAERLGLPSDQVASCIADLGNTSAATIPLALSSWRQGKGLSRGDLILFTAFAGGLLWGAGVIRWF